MKSIILTFLLCHFVTVLKAHNNYFLPGDAFFSISLSREVIQNLTKNDATDFDFTYTRYDGNFMACGNIGYTKLKITGIDKNFKLALTEAYKNYTRSTNPEFIEVDSETKKLLQTNAVVALIYNSDFQGFYGLKYNENWNEEGEGIYGGFFKSAKPVQIDWQLAKDIKPLKLSKPIKPLDHLTTEKGVHHTINEPLEISAKQIKIALVGITNFAGYGTRSTCPNLKSIFLQEPYTEYTVVSPNSYHHFYIDENGKTTEEIVKFP